MSLIFVAFSQNATASVHVSVCVCVCMCAFMHVRVHAYACKRACNHSYVSTVIKKKVLKVRM